MMLKLASFLGAARLKQTDAKIHEDACHEGNGTVMEGILAGARAQDRLTGR